MKTLSIHQPWAWAIFDPKASKSIENRTWPTRYRGPLLIHASKSRASYDREKLFDWRGVYGVEMPPWESLVTGAIIGVADLVDCVPIGQVRPTPWTEGPWCWVLENPQTFAEPIPFRGMQGLFEAPDGILPVTV